MRHQFSGFRLQLVFNAIFSGVSRSTINIVILITGSPGRAARRYREGSYRARRYPSPFLSDWLERLSFSNGARALDLGCGAGRNSLFLAQQGFDVHGYDISQVALDQAQMSATEQGLTVNLQCADMDSHQFPAKCWDLVVMIRFMNRALHPQLPSLLKPNGILIVEHHIVTHLDVSGPQPADQDSFRLRANEILDTCNDLHIVSYQEKIATDRDERPVALAQLVASPHPVLV